ncbi:MAG: hypothetical protein WC451_05240 [Patescibacteria group bacterium]
MLPETKKDLKAYQEAMQIAVDFSEPQFEMANRLFELWRGKPPEVLERTFSRININLAHAMVQDRLPKFKANMFGSDDFVSLEATTPELEVSVDDAEAWLQNMFRDESKLNIISEIEPTLQSVAVIGTGYRMPCLKHVKVGERWEPVILSKDIDFFQILPMPDGGLVNPLDRYSEDAISGFFHIDWMTDDQIKALKEYKGFNKSEAEELFKTKAGEDREGLENALEKKYDIVSGVAYQSKDDWREKMSAVDGLQGRRRIVNWFRRDSWWIIAQDRFVIYKGPNPMGDSGLLPLVKYVCTPDFKNWHGIGSLEMLEDMLHAILMNFGYRMDYLAKVMFPSKWIRKDVMQGQPKSAFYDRPYAVHQFPNVGQPISNLVWIDRMPEINNQTFMEEDRLKAFVQEISGLPNYSKGMGGQGTLGNETATGIVSLIRQAAGRIDAESLMLEYSGLAQEARLLLALAAKHITEPQMLRNPRSPNGFRWSMVDAEALTGDYVIRTHGTRTMSDKEQVFQRLLAMYPFLNGNPLINQYELLRQTLDVSNIPNVNRLLPQPNEEMMASMAMGGQMVPGEMSGESGGLASAQNVRNPQRSVANRTGVEANTGRQTVPAGMPL